MMIQHQHCIGCITLITCSPRIGTVLERPAGCLRQVPFELIAAGVLNKELGKSRGAGPCWEPPERIRSSNQGGAKFVFDTYVREMLEREASGTEAKASALAETASKALQGVALMRIEVMNEISMPQVFLWMQESSLFSPGSLLCNPQPGISFRASDLVRNLVLACYMDLPLEDQEEAYHRLWLEPLELEYPGPDAMESLLASFIKAKHPGILRQGRRHHQGHRGLPAVPEGSGSSPAGPQEEAARRHVSGFEKTINSLVEGGAAAGGQQMRGAVLYSKWVSVIQEGQIKAPSAAAAAASMPPPHAAPPRASGKKRGHGGGPTEEEEVAEQGGPRVQAAQGPASLVDPRRAVRDATEGLLRDLAAFAGTAIGEGREGGGSCRGPASSAPCLPPSAPPSARAIRRMMMASEIEIADAAAATPRLRPLI